MAKFRQKFSRLEIIRVSSHIYTIFHRIEDRCDQKFKSAITMKSSGQEADILVKLSSDIEAFTVKFSDL